MTEQYSITVEELFPSEDPVDSSEDEEREVGETEEMEVWSDGGGSDAFNAASATILCAEGVFRHPL